jgi:PPP family 3-phenylpropionic acid transporter
MNLSKNNLPLILSLFYLFYFALIGVYIIFMPKVLKDLGFSAVQIGIIYASGPFMRFLLPFIFKKYIKLDIRVFKISLISTFLITLLFFITIKNFWAYLLLNIFFGGASGIMLPFSEVIALEQIGKKKYGKIRLWGSVGFSLIAFILGNFLNSYITALTFLSALSFFILIFGLKLSKFENKKSAQKEIEQNKNFSLLKYPFFWISVFLFQFSFGAFYNFFTIYETSSGIELDIVSYLWIFGVVCEIVMLFLQGKLLEEFNLLNLILISIIVTIFRWLIVALFPNNLILILIAQATHAFGFALYYSATIAYVYTLYSQKKLAQQFLLGVGFGLGGAIGAAVAGVIYKFSPSGAFLFESLIATLSAIFIILHKIRIKNET